MICIIPARGGSRRIPRKNIKDFMGKPMLSYAIDVAVQAGIFGEIFVTTDDKEIADIAHAHGASVHFRNPALCEDSVGTQRIMAEVLLDLRRLGYRYDTACCLYPCVPLLDSKTLVAARHILGKHRAAYVFAVGETPSLHDAGQFYMGETEAFLSNYPLIDPATSMFPVPPERDCDINTPEDWEMAIKKFDALRGVHVH